MRYTLPLMLAASALAAPLALPTESSKIPIPIIDFSSSGSATLPGASTESPRPPLLPVTTSSTSGSASAALPNPSGAAKFRPDRPGQRFACDNPKKWPNGIIPLIAHNAKEMDQNACDSCLGLVNPPPDSPPPTSSPTEGHLPSPSPKLSARFATNSTIPLPVTNVTGNATVTGTATFYQYNNFTGVVSHSLVAVAPDQTSATCGFILDVGLLAQVLEAPGGPCDQVNNTLATLDPLKDADKIGDTKKAYADVINAITSTNNTAYIDLSLDRLLVDEVAKSANKTTYSYKANASDPGLFTRLGAVADLLNKTGNSSLVLAGQVDGLLSSSFPGMKTNLSSTYNNFVLFAAHAADAAKTVKGNRPAPSGSSSRPFGSSSTRRPSNSRTSTHSEPTTSKGHPDPSSGSSFSHHSSSSHEPSGSWTSTHSEPTISKGHSDPSSGSSSSHHPSSSTHKPEPSETATKGNHPGGSSSHGSVRSSTPKSSTGESSTKSEPAVSTTKGNVPAPSSSSGHKAPPGETSTKSGPALSKTKGNGPAPSSSSTHRPPTGETSTKSEPVVSKTKGNGPAPSPSSVHKPPTGETSTHGHPAPSSTPSRVPVESSSSHGAHPSSEDPISSNSHTAAHKPTGPPPKGPTVSASHGSQRPTGSASHYAKGPVASSSHIPVPSQKSTGPAAPSQHSTLTAATKAPPLRSSSKGIPASTHHSGSTTKVATHSPSHAASLPAEQN